MMITSGKTFNVLRLALAAAAGTAAAGLGVAALAQTTPANPPAPSSTPASANVLSLGELESRLSAQGITIREIEVRDLLVEVEGYDAEGRKVELLVDRRSGETLSRKLDR
jgi:Peptidase propeptide and YPEB domain